MTRQDEFRARYPNWQHKDVPFGEHEQNRLCSVWKMMLDSQNGRDVDDIVHGRMINLLKKSGLENGHGKALLILGCGTGEEITEAGSLGWSAFGITLGPMNVACAEERGIYVDFEDFHTSKYGDSCFDAIVGSQIWEHSWTPFIFAMECARVLKPNGKLVLETPCAAEYLYDSSNIHHVFCPTPYQGRMMLEKAGFVDVKTMDGSNGELVPFSDEEFGYEHRDDVGGEKITFIGTRWTDKDKERINPLVRKYTNGER